jgi:hypothetical protein
MKYFTQELIVLGQTTDDEILNEQEQLWEQAGERYVAYLKTVRPQFPPGLKWIDEHYYLHDAMILGMGRHDHSLVMVLRLDPPPRSLLTFTYDLLEEPRITEKTLPWESSSYWVEWQYDEIEMIPGTPPTWAQSILLSNGWEVRLHFREVQVQEAQALIPAPGNGQAKAADSALAPSQG